MEVRLSSAIALGNVTGHRKVRSRRQGYPALAGSCAVPLYNSQFDRFEGLPAPAVSRVPHARRRLAWPASPRAGFSAQAGPNATPHRRARHSDRQSPNIGRGPRCRRSPTPDHSNRRRTDEIVAFSRTALTPTLHTRDLGTQRGRRRGKHRSASRAIQSTGGCFSTAKPAPAIRRNQAPSLLAVPRPPCLI